MAPFMLLLFLLSPVVSELQVKPVKPGDDVTLPCSAGDGSIRAVEWTRPDLKSPEYVLFYSDGYLKSPFKGRVDLADREMKDGDVSLVLKNVIISDSGKYECRVATVGPSRRKRAKIDTDPISIIQLEVTASGEYSKYTMDGDHKDTTNMDGDHKDTPNRDGNKRIGLTVGLTAAAFILICSAVVGVFLWKKKNKAVGNQLI